MGYLNTKQPVSGKKPLFALVLFLLISLTGNAQDFALHNNVAFDVMGDLSLGTEIALKPRTTVELYGALRPWQSSGDKRNEHWLVQGQYRFYTCQKYNGFYWGPYMHAGEFNMADASLPFGLLKGLKTSRYEGWLMGGGLGIGYEYILSKHWNVGAEIGAGYTYIHYKKFDCGVCGSLDKKSDYHYVGISKFGLNLIYLF